MADLEDKSTMARLTYVVLLCEDCGREVLPSWEYCRYCGARVAQVRVAIDNIPSLYECRCCGRKYVELGYCTVCGDRLVLRGYTHGADWHVELNKSVTLDNTGSGGG